MSWRRVLAVLGVGINDQAPIDPDKIYLDGYRAGYSKGRQAEAVEWHEVLFEDGGAPDWPDAARWTPDRVRRPAAVDLADDGLPGDGQSVALTGRLVDVDRHVNRTGAPWASAGLELLGSDEVVQVRVFPQLYQRVARLVWDDEKVTLSGRVDRREDATVVIVAELVAGGV